jgi:AI-2 transport protein TqsA
MNTPSFLSSVAYVLVILAILVAGMNLAAAFVSPILFAFFLAIIVLPVIRWFEKRRLPAGIAVLATTGIVVLFALIVVAFVSVSLFQLQGALPAYQNLISSQVASLESWLSDLGVPVDLPEPIQPDDNPFIPDIGSILSGLSMLVIDFLVLVIVLTSLMQEIQSIRYEEGRRRGIFTGIAEPFVRRSRNLIEYFWIRTRVNVGAGVAIAIYLYILGIDTPVLWAVLFVLLSYIPYFGWVLALLPPTGVGWLQYGLIGAIAVLAGIVVIDRVVHHVLFPHNVDEILSLSPPAIILSIFLWALVLGVPGLFLGPPLTLMLKAFLESSPETQWMARFLEPSIPRKNR